jgi:hypothetical protein
VVVGLIARVALLIVTRPSSHAYHHHCLTTTDY